jgi:hypothetical protein
VCPRKAQRFCLKGATPDEPPPSNKNTQNSDGTTFEKAGDDIVHIHIRGLHYKFSFSQHKERMRWQRTEKDPTNKPTKKKPHLPTKVNMRKHTGITRPAQTGKQKLMNIIKVILPLMGILAWPPAHATRRKQSKKDLVQKPERALCSLKLAENPPLRSIDPDHRSSQPKTKPNPSPITDGTQARREASAPESSLQRARVNFFCRVGGLPAGPINAKSSRQRFREKGGCKSIATSDGWWHERGLRENASFAAIL